MTGCRNQAVSLTASAAVSSNEAVPAGPRTAKESRAVFARVFQGNHRNGDAREQFAARAQDLGEENRGWNVCPFGKDLRIKGENERSRAETTISMPGTIKTDFRIYQDGALVGFVEEGVGPVRYQEQSTEYPEPVPCLPPRQQSQEEADDGFASAAMISSGVFCS